MPYFLLNNKLRDIVDKCEVILDACREQEEIKLKEKLVKIKADNKIDFKIIQIIHEILNRNKENFIYLHEVIENCDLYLPKYEPVPRVGL
jgi:adenylate kinase